MTSKSLFLVNSKENHKRRGWVWIVSMLVQLAFYPGIMTVYMSRIRVRHSMGEFRAAASYKDALLDAAADALGFKLQAPYVVGLLAIMIGIQGFSYLYSRKKVDMYHSVPIPSKSRFAVVYINGIVIYITTYLLSIIPAVGIAVMNGAIGGKALIECGLAVVLNILYFLAIYHAAILAVMLTGNIFITGGVTMALLCIDFFLVSMLDGMRTYFFRTADMYFADTDMKLGLFWTYKEEVYRWKTEIHLPNIINTLLPFFLKCAVYAAIFGILAYLCYKKRPSEAAGRAIAFPAVKPVLKVVLSVTAGITACSVLYGSVFGYMGIRGADYGALSVGQALLLCGGSVLAAIICCGAIEAVYEFDIRAVIKHIASTCVSAVIVAAIFCIYNFDLFGYDRYVPDPEKVESAAVFFFYDQSYFEFEESDGSFRYVSEIDWMKDNMFVTDIDAVCSLIENDREIDGNLESMEDGRQISVLFRLKSGREVSRRYAVDFADASTEELLNRIIGTKEFREGYYQIFKAEDIVQRNNWKISYSNGIMHTDLSVEAVKLREAWMKDMEGFDFSLARNNRQCGYLDFAIPKTSREWRLPVYESFENTIAYLEEEGVYVPAKVRAEDVASITVVNWNHDMQDGDAWDSYNTGSESADLYYSQTEYRIRKTYDTPDEIAEIIDVIFPGELCYTWRWNDKNGYEDNYDVYITFKPDTEYYYIPDSDYGCEFISGQVPEFVQEDTTYVP